MTHCYFIFPTPNNDIFLLDSRN